MAATPLFFRIIDTLFATWKSWIYLTFVDAVQMLKHLSNMNVIQKTKKYVVRLEVSQIGAGNWRNGQHQTPSIGMGNILISALKTTKRQITSTVYSNHATKICMYHTISKMAHKYATTDEWKHMKYLQQQHMSTSGHQSPYSSPLQSCHNKHDGNIIVPYCCSQ